MTGPEIVFSSDRTGTFDLWVMRADGTGLTDESSTDLWPNWSN
jgi:Tol biopolymer transport system component